jgi:hypothetical protein
MRDLSLGFKTLNRAKKQKVLACMTAFATHMFLRVRGAISHVSNLATLNGSLSNIGTCQSAE